MNRIIRRARIEDVGDLKRLIELSARTLGKADYTDAQIEAALQGAWGVDTQLIVDGTYFAVESEGKLVACGGWSKRKTLFGSDAHKDRKPELLNATRDPARIRAFFVHPDFARSGLGRLLLEKCEAEAKAVGFASAELVATLPGVPLYASCGYVEMGRRRYPLDGGVEIEFVKMRKSVL